MDIAFGLHMQSFVHLEQYAVWIWSVHQTGNPNLTLTLIFVKKGQKVHIRGAHFYFFASFFPWQLKTPFLTEKYIQKQKTEEKAPKIGSPPYTFH